MRETIKAILGRTFLRDVAERWLAWKRLRAWDRSGRPAPAPEPYKHLVVRAYGKAFGLRVFIESGTYLGRMVAHARRYFRVIHSIELDEALFAQASRRFASDRRVTIWQGDSGRKIGDILRDLHEPALFWLDGHYSEGITARGELSTPIVAELQAILQHSVKDHVILVDDARCFDGTEDYPTITQIESLVRASRPDLGVVVHDDVIRIHRPTAAGLP